MAPDHRRQTAARPCGPDHRRRAGWVEDVQVTKVLTVLGQASHALVPPDTLETVVHAIANNFVADHCAAEVMTVGLNAIREIAARAPLAMSETLLRDLAQYKNAREKGTRRRASEPRRHGAEFAHTDHTLRALHPAGVAIAARALISLFREVDPTLLHKKDRGRTAQENMDTFTVPRYGDQRAVDHVPGAEVRCTDRLAVGASHPLAPFLTPAPVSLPLLPSPLATLSFCKRC